jgi:hypothetical protein
MAFNDIIFIRIFAKISQLVSEGKKKSEAIPVTDREGP